MGIKRSIEEGTYAAVDLIQENSLVHNSRQGIYKRKAEIVKTPMVREIIHAVVGDSSHPPIYIEIYPQGILTRPYDVESDTYHPNGILAYTPEIVFDYEIACALCLIIQDMYPDIYDFPNTTITGLSGQLEKGTWTTKLILKQEHLYKEIAPNFNIDEIAAIPFAEMPIQLEDQKGKGYSKLPNVSFWLGIVSIALCWMKGLIVLSAVAGIITGIMGINTSQNKKKCVAGIIMCVLGGFILPFIISIFLFQNWVNSGFGLF